MEKQKSIMAVGFILIAMLSFFITKESNEPTDTAENNFKIESADVQNPKKVPANEIVTVQQFPTEKISTEETTEDKVKQTLKNYYQHITEKNFQAAYSILSWDMQNIMGTSENFSRGYDTTISSTAQNISVVSNSETEFVLGYDLTARDRFENNRIKVQNFRGTAVLKFFEDRWYIDNKSVKTIGEHIE